MKEIVVLSGKGGTGKTSVTASLAALAHQPVLVDCDVDAADLHLILAPSIRTRHDFYAGNEAVIHQGACVRCGACLAHCRYCAVAKEKSPTGDPLFRIDPVMCEGCGVCVRFCPVGAIDFPDRFCGEWMISDTRFGPMVHARLGVVAENSGKLVSTVRREARRIAEKTGRSLILADGPPGIGCPVIASVTGASLALAVTEPTVSGEHDLERLLSLARHFNIPVAVCVNKWDINPDVTQGVEEMARRAGAHVVGRIRYDAAVTQAQVQALALVEYADSGSAEDVKDMWDELKNLVNV